MLKRCTAALAASLIALAVPGAHAQTVQPWPTRPVTMIVPFAAGGPTDVVGRILAQRLGEVLGQQVIVENLGGAGGMAGAQKIAQARPDGYQILLGTVGT
ncbi:MAG: tripartite tricarboxylate transporter substrate-binding protein, partial [Xanthobacteraceae bacterium]